MQSSLTFWWQSVSWRLYASPESHYEQLYYEARFTKRITSINLDIKLSVIGNSFLKACKQEDYEKQTATGEFYRDVFDVELLRTKLDLIKLIFGVHFHQIYVGETNTSIWSSLVLPATNVCSERSFSVLRRVKTYLHATMKQHAAHAYLGICVYLTSVKRTSRWWST